LEVFVPIRLKTGLFWHRTFVIYGWPEGVFLTLTGTSKNVDLPLF